MKHIKTLLCFLLVAAITLSLCSCGLFASRVASNKVVEQLEQNIASLQNFPSIPTITTQHEVALKRGNEVGNVCYDYALPVITTKGVQEETIDPTAYGKVTVINFWYTSNTPSVAELPYLDSIARKYSEDVKVVAVHGMLLNTAANFIRKNYPDSPIVFLADFIPEENKTEDDAMNEMYRIGYYTMLGGKNRAYPYTVVLNERGIITHVFHQSVTESELETAVLQAMGRM